MLLYIRVNFLAVDGVIEAVQGMEGFWEEGFRRRSQSMMWEERVDQMCLWWFRATGRGRQADQLGVSCHFRRCRWISLCGEKMADRRCHSTTCTKPRTRTRIHTLFIGKNSNIPLSYHKIAEIPQSFLKLQKWPVTLTFLKIVSIFILYRFLYKALDPEVRSTCDLTRTP